MTDTPQRHPGAQEPRNSGRHGPQSFDRRMLEALLCPLTLARLVYDAQRQELVSESARIAFPIRDGIPIMLVDEARKIDAHKIDE